MRSWTRTGYDIPARWDGVWLGREILPASSPPGWKWKIRRRGGDGKSQNWVGFLGDCVKFVEKNDQIGEQSENHNLRWGPPDSADGSVLKS